MASQHLGRTTHQSKNARNEYKTRKMSKVNKRTTKYRLFSLMQIPFVCPHGAHHFSIIIFSGCCCCCSCYKRSGRREKKMRVQNFYCRNSWKIFSATWLQVTSYNSSRSAAQFLEPFSFRFIHKTNTNRPCTTDAYTNLCFGFFSLVCLLELSMLIKKYAKRSAT